MNQRPSLGRGLSALLNDNVYADKTFQSPYMEELPLNQLQPGRYQPRKDFQDEDMSNLIQSIREKGIIQPLLVRPLDQGNYEIIAGERRWRAAKIIGLEEVPVIIRHDNDQEALETALIENIQRNDLNAIEEAEAYYKLIQEFGHTQEQLASVIGKSRSHIANTLRLMNLPSSAKELVRQKKLSAGHARALLNQDDIETKARMIVEKGMNVRDTEKLQKSSTFMIDSHPFDEQTIYLQQQIHNLLGLPTNLKIKKNGATLTIHFKNFEEIDELLEKLRHF